LCNWQSMVVQEGFLHSPKIGDYRDHESPMQIVSGAIGYEQVHYEAPPSARVSFEMESFIDWYNSTAPIDGVESISGAVRAGLAHARFEHIHPFEDGNGRVGRAIVDHALSQSDGFPALACLSTSIEQQKKEYYELLEESGRGEGLDANKWLDFFVDVVGKAQELTRNEIEFIVGKTRYFDKFSDQLNERQEKAIARVFAEGSKGFEGGLTTKKYQAITKCGRGTAFRDLTDLLEKGAVAQSGTGRGTRYELVSVGSSLPTGWNRTDKLDHGDKDMDLALNTFTDEEIETLEEKISEIMEHNDPLDRLEITEALDSTSISQLEAALETLTDMDINFSDLMGEVSPTEWRAVSMDFDAVSDRHDQSSSAIREQLTSSLYTAVGKEMDCDVWKAVPGRDYQGEVARIDDTHIYTQLSDNAISAHSLHEMNPQQIELLREDLSIGDFAKVNELGAVEKAEPPKEQEIDRGHLR
ncbi:MAG: Fic family protein, partial [bacterium]|nr:Fic family protein [bacterium]